MGFLSKIKAAGYHEYSKSNNALDAEEEGRYPLTEASSILAKKLKWSISKAKAFLESIGTSEWHHTSKHYNKTKYYDVSDAAIEDLKDEIKNFEYSPIKKVKKVKPFIFKCWNLDRDPRSWDWKITNREGAYTYPLERAKEIILRKKKLIENKNAKEKTRTWDIKNKRLDVINEALEQIEIYLDKNKEILAITLHF